MDIEQIKNKLNKNVILVLKNKYSYRGKITKVYDSSFEFTDFLGNELSQDIEDVSSVITEKDNNQQTRSITVQSEGGESNKQTSHPTRRDGTTISDEGKHGTGTRKPSLSPSADKKPFILTDKMAIAWKDIDVTEGQRRVLLKMEFSDKDIDNMSKLDAFHTISNCSKENI